MKKMFAVSMLAASLSLSFIPSAHAFGVKSIFNKADASDVLDLSDSLLFLSSILDTQNSTSFLEAEQAFASAAAAEQISGSVSLEAAISSLNEGFTNISTLSASGWAFQNNSSPPPSTTTTTGNWEQGNASVVAGSAGQNDTSYIYASSTSSITGDTGQLSNWLITPEINFSTTNTFSFVTRTNLGNPNPELLEVRLSTSGASTDVGNSVSSVGVFTTLLRTIGSTTDQFAYPGTLNATNAFQQFNLNVSPQSGSGRIAFRYASPISPIPGFEQAGLIAIDSVSYSAVPEPAMASGFSGFAVLGLAQFFKSKRKKA